MIPITLGVRAPGRPRAKATMLNISPATENGMFSQFNEPRHGTRPTRNPSRARMPQARLRACMSEKSPHEYENGAGRVRQECKEHWHRRAIRGFRLREIPASDGQESGGRAAQE